MFCNRVYNNKIQTYWFRGRLELPAVQTLISQIIQIGWRMTSLSKHTQTDRHKNG